MHVKQEVAYRSNIAQVLSEKMHLKLQIIGKFNQFYRLGTCILTFIHFNIFIRLSEHVTQDFKVSINSTVIWYRDE